MTEEIVTKEAKIAASHAMGSRRHYLPSLISEFINPESGHEVIVIETVKKQYLLKQITNVQEIQLQDRYKEIYIEGISTKGKRVMVNLKSITGLELDGTDA